MRDRARPPPRGLLETRPHAVPALRGSLTYVRFFVQGTLPDDFRERFMRSIRHRVMRPLEAEDEDLERSGWCLIGDPYGLELSYDEVFYAGFVNLGLRTDRWQIPGSSLRAAMKDAEKAYLAKKGRERLSRRERTELKELVSRKLRRQMTPQTRMADVSWALDEGLVRFFSHSPKSAAQLTEVFGKTFGTHGLTLVPESPWTLAERLGVTKAQAAAWNDLEVTLLASEGE